MLSLSGIERQPISQVVCRSLSAWIRPGSYADLATGFNTTVEQSARLPAQ